MMDEIEDESTLDAGIIASAQSIEHYAMSRDGTIIAWARQLGHDEVADILQKNLTQEEEADRKLTDLAISPVNKKAAYTLHDRVARRAVSDRVPRSSA